MPTGYTAGIIDGEIKTFDQFAKKCMRAFGATIHMRDEPMDKEYEPREPSSYHTDKIQEIKNEIEKIESLSNDEIVQLRTDELRSEIKRQSEAIKKNKKTEKKLRRMLNDVQDWNPPSENHTGFKNFMIEQLEKTIEFDCGISWQESALKKAEEQITSIVGEFERERILQKLNKDLEYHQAEHQKKVERCEQANEWVQKLVESL